MGNPTVFQVLKKQQLNTTVQKNISSTLEDKPEDEISVLKDTENLEKDQLIGSDVHQNLNQKVKDEKSLQQISSNKNNTSTRTNTKKEPTKNKTKVHPFSITGLSLSSATLLFLVGVLLGFLYALATGVGTIVYIFAALAIASTIVGIIFSLLGIGKKKEGYGKKNSKVAWAGFIIGALLFFISGLTILL